MSRGVPEIGTDRHARKSDRACGRPDPGSEGPGSRAFPPPRSPGRHWGTTVATPFPLSVRFNSSARNRAYQKTGPGKDSTEMSIGRICTRVVATAGPEESVRDVAERMAEHNVGTIVVVDSDRPVGILTDRDLAVRVLATGLDPESTRIGDVMTERPRALDESTPIEEALAVMKGSGVRRILVTGSHGALAGIVALDDVLELLVEEMETIGKILRKESPELSST